MKKHPYVRVGFQGLSQHLTSTFSVARFSAFQKHHRMEAAYLRLFEEKRKRLGMMHRDLKMLLSVFPLTGRCRCDTRDRMRQAEDREKRHCSSADQLANERVKLTSLRSLA